MKATESIYITCSSPTRLSEILRERGMSQKQLAAVTGLTEASISRLVSGERAGRVDTLFRIAKALNVRIDDLVRRTDTIHYGGDK